jgi:hypothetical protein
MLEIVEDINFMAANAGGQASFMDDLEHRYCAYAGGWFAGKTWAGARKSANLHVLDAFDKNGQPTYCKGLVVAQNYSLAATQCVPEMEAAFDEMGLSHKYIGGGDNGHRMELPDLGTKDQPSTILVRSAEAPETITSFTVAWAWGDEAARWPVNRTNPDPKINPFIQIDGRVRDPRAQVRQINYTYTPEGDDTQVFRDFEEEPLPDHVLYRSNTAENPSATEFSEAIARRLTPKLAEQYLAGRTIRLLGQPMYSAFDKDANVSKDVALIKGIPLHLSIDFNIDPGMHGVIGQRDVANDMLTAFDILHSDRLDARNMIADLARWVEKQGGWQWSELEVFGDASGRGAWAGTGETCWDIIVKGLKDVGWPFRLRVPMSNPLVFDRVNTFNCALHDLDGKTRYKIHPRCVRLINDLKVMKWKRGEADKDDRKVSHASDAEGYRVWLLRPIRRPELTEGRIGAVSASGGDIYYEGQ